MSVKPTYERTNPPTPAPPSRNDQERGRVRLFGNQFRWAKDVIQRAMAEHRSQDCQSF